MKRLKKITALSAVLLFAMVINASAQQVTKAQLSKAWDDMTAMVVGTAKVMPAEHYSWTPAEGIAYFGKLVSHQIQANYGFAPAIFGLEKPANPPTWDDEVKEDVVKTMEASFKYIKDGIDKMTQADLDEQVEVFGNTTSRLRAILILTSHLQREHGKAITYVRIKGVAPAGSGGW